MTTNAFNGLVESARVSHGMFAKARAKGPGRDLSRFAALMGVALLAGGARAQVFDFADGLQGWRVFDVHYLGDHVPNRIPQAAMPAWDTLFGLPAPSIRATDLSANTAIGAPASIHGNRDDLYGQSFTFDIMYRLRDEATYMSAGIQSTTLSLWVSEPPPPLGVWLHREYPLEPGVWRVGTISGPVATQAQIHEVLGALNGVYINTEWRTGSDDTSVDNIFIGAPCTLCCIADFNASGGTPDDADVDAFFTAWNNGEERADVNHSGGTPDDADVDYFFTRWNAGC